ncbi:MAG: hypothetical protein EU539_06940, partial [Promethearchaeota archaeon]
MVAPYPKDNLCPNCRKNFLELEKFDQVEKKKKDKKKKKSKKKPVEDDLKPKEFIPKELDLSQKLEGKVKVKKPPSELKKLGDKIDLQKGDYI